MNTNTVDVSALLNNAPIRKFHILILVLCTLLVLLDGFDAQVVGFVISDLARSMHVERSSFGPVFSAGFAGLPVGSLLMGVAADRYGRKTVLLLAVVTFSLASLATAFATSLDTLLLLRFVTGVGVGGAVPNALALMGEFAPKSSRATMMTILGSGVSVGAAGAGILTSFMLPRYGWTSLFYFGAIAPLLLLPFLVFLLPESLRFLIAKRQHSRQQVIDMVRKIAPDTPTDANTTFLLKEETRPGLPVKHLFTGGRSTLTLLLWLAFLLNLAVLYTLIPWLPTMLHEGGLSVPDASLVAAAFSIGGIFGAIGVGRCIDWRGAYPSLVAIFIAGAVSLVALAMLQGLFVPLLVAVFFAGFCIAGGQHGANAHAGLVYPTFMRSTGVGWAMGLGRIASALGPMMLGALLAWHWSFAQILQAFAVATVGTALVFGILGVISSRRAAQVAGATITAS
jgi:AAHS family 4-hydroxybenzoate transporter-like MFS transporter